MKRLIIVMIALIVNITLTTAQSNTEDVPFMAQFERLTTYLKLRASQKTKVKDLNENFIQMQKTCKVETTSSQGQKMQQVLLDNLSGMREVLSDIQFEKYISLLNTTNKNKNIIDDNLFADLVKQAGEK